MRTTYGSPLFRDHVPTADTLVVARLRRAGAIVIGKTNTPEFGAGSQTFNPVFGATRNPYDLARTSGGSSGGAAVAVAAGMTPLADGSDLGASIRNPASFCNIVGLRPSPGRVPEVPAAYAWNPMGVHGPLARSVEDAALLLRAMAGPDPRAPLSLPEPPDTFVLGPAADPRGAADRLEPQPRRPPGRPRGDRRAAGQPRARWRRWAASSRTSSPTSPAPTRPSRSCAASASRTPSAICWRPAATASRTRSCGTPASASR